MTDYDVYKHLLLATVAEDRQGAVDSYITEETLDGRRCLITYHIKGRSHCDMGFYFDENKKFVDVITSK